MLKQVRLPLIIKGVAGRTERPRWLWLNKEHEVDVPEYSRSEIDVCYVVERHGPSRDQPNQEVLHYGGKMYALLSGPGGDAELDGMLLSKLPTARPFPEGEIADLISCDISKWNLRTRVSQLTDAIVGSGLRRSRIMDGDKIEFLPKEQSFETKWGVISSRNFVDVDYNRGWVRKLDEAEYERAMSEHAYHIDRLAVIDGRVYLEVGPPSAVVNFDANFGEMGFRSDYPNDLPYENRSFLDGDRGEKLRLEFLKRGYRINGLKDNPLLGFDADKVNFVMATRNLVDWCGAYMRTVKRDTSYLQEGVELTRLTDVVLNWKYWESSDEMVENFEAAVSLWNWCGCPTYNDAHDSRGSFRIRRFMESLKERYNDREVVIQSPAPSPHA
jgi:hypothetical protein